MGHSSAVCFVAFALCLVACVSAGASAETNGNEKQEVEAANQSINKICAKAQTWIHNATSVLETVEPIKKKVEEVKSQAEQALSQAEKALSQAKEKEEAKAMVDKIKNCSNTVSKLHINITKELENSVTSLKELLSISTTLQGECNKEKKPDTESGESYADPKAKASALKTKEGELDTIINATVKLMNGVDSTGKKMRKSLKEAQLETLHVRVIVAVAKFETMSGEIDSTIEKTENQKKQIDDIIHEMLKLNSTAPTASTEYFQALHKSADDALTNVTSAVKNATNTKAELTKLKGQDGAALTNVKDAKEDTSAQKEVDIAKSFVSTVEQISLQLQTALQTADDSVTNASVLKQKMVTALSTTTRKPGTAQSKEKEKTNRLMVVGTEHYQNDATIQPTLSVPLLVALIASAFLQ